MRLVARVATTRLVTDLQFPIRLRRGLATLALLGAMVAGLPGIAAAQGTEGQVLAFYYGWYGNPDISGRWVHWQGVDPADRQIANAAHFPELGAYDSHDPKIVERHMEEARAAGLTGLIASWFGQGTFEDQGIPLLLSGAGRHDMSVSVLYEKIAGADPAARIGNAVADLNYLLSHYAGDKAWLRVGGKPVLFVYGRALRELSPADWQLVIGRVRRDNPGGMLLIATALDPPLAPVFDGIGRYNFAQLAQQKTSPQLRAWAHAYFPQIVAAAGSGKISTVTIIPGCDDSKSNRPPPRPVIDRWNGETYRALWQEAIAAAPDWVLITSWNEWHEGTEIEPSVEYGSRALADTAAFSRQFLARKGRVEQIR
jgi:glycoprotein endo-alpha-1,2-mannosidase